MNNVIVLVEDADVQFISGHGDDGNVQRQVVDDPPIGAILAGQVAELGQIQRHHQVGKFADIAGSQLRGWVAVTAVDTDVDDRVIRPESGDQTTCHNVLRIRIFLVLP